MIWVFGAGGSEVIPPGGFIEGDGNSSINTLAGPSLCPILAWRGHLLQRLSLVERAEFLVLGNFSLVFVL
jgi:hypothetical protein